jgi:hypothetical protein
MTQGTMAKIDFIHCKRCVIAYYTIPNLIQKLNRIPVTFHELLINNSRYNVYQFTKQLYNNVGVQDLAPLHLYQ